MVCTAGQSVDLAVSRVLDIFKENEQNIPIIYGFLKGAGASVDVAFGKLCEFYDFSDDSSDQEEEEAGGLDCSAVTVPEQYDLNDDFNDSNSDARNIAEIATQESSSQSQCTTIELEKSSSATEEAEHDVIVLESDGNESSTDSEDSEKTISSRRLVPQCTQQSKEKNQLINKQPIGGDMPVVQGKLLVNDSNAKVIHKTTGDGNCSFHAIFGRLKHGECQAKQAQNMRMDLHCFLQRFHSLGDPNMNCDLNTILKSVFRAIIESRTHFQMTRVGTVFKKIYDQFIRKDEAIGAAVRDIVTNITASFNTNHTFRKIIYDMWQEECKRTGKKIESMEIVLSDDSKLLNMIHSNLKECIFLYEEQGNRTETETVYDHDILLEQTISGPDFYKAYLNVIKDQEYQLLTDEIEIVAALANIEIILYYTGDNKNCKIITPKTQIIGDYAPSTVWGNRDQVRKVVIQHTGQNGGFGHFSRVQLLEYPTTNKASSKLSNAPANRGAASSKLSNAPANRGAASSKPSNAPSNRGTASSKPSNAPSNRGTASIKPNNAPSNRGTASSKPNNAPSNRGTASSKPNNAPAPTQSVNRRTYTIQKESLDTISMDLNRKICNLNKNDAVNTLKEIKIVECDSDTIIKESRVIVPQYMFKEYKFNESCVILELQDLPQREQDWIKTVFNPRRKRWDINNKNQKTLLLSYLTSQTQEGIDNTLPDESIIPDVELARNQNDLMQGDFPLSSSHIVPDVTMSDEYISICQKLLGASQDDAGADHCNDDTDDEMREMLEKALNNGSVER